jgi:hypothetical protein
MQLGVMRQIAPDDLSATRAPLIKLSLADETRPFARIMSPDASA